MDSSQDPENFGWRGQVFGICLAIPRAEHPQVMNDKVKEVSLVREQTQDSFDGFEELYKRLFIN